MLNHRLILLILLSFFSTILSASQTSTDIGIDPSTLNVQGDVGRVLEYKLTLTNLTASTIPIVGPGLNPPLDTVTINTTDTTCGTTLGSHVSCILAFNYAPKSTGTATQIVRMTNPSSAVYTEATVNLTAVNPPLQVVDFRTFNASDNDIIQIVSAAGGKTTATPRNLTINTSDNLESHQMTSLIACPVESTTGFLQFNISAYSWQGAYSADKPGQPYVNTCVLSFNCNNDQLSVDVPDTTCQAFQQYYYDAVNNLTYILN